MYPHIIHQIWIGPKPIPDQCRKYRADFKLFYPDWEMRLFGNKELEETCLVDPILRQMVQENCDAALLSDRIRLLLLYNFGGLYADIDAQPVQHVSALLPRLRRSFIISTDCLDLDVMLAIPRLPLIRQALDTCWQPDIHVRAGPVASWLVANDNDKQIQILPKSFCHSMVRTQNTFFLHRSHMLRSWHTPATVANYKNHLKGINHD